jgi:hypothetical protein
MMRLDTRCGCDGIAGLEDYLRRHGVEDKVIAAVLSEAIHRSA